VSTWDDVDEALRQGGSLRIERYPGGQGTGGAEFEAEIVQQTDFVSHQGYGDSAKESVKEALKSVRGEYDRDSDYGNNRYQPNDYDERDDDDDNGEEYSDVTVDAEGGSLFLFRFHTPGAEAWRDENIPADATYWGDALVVEGRGYAVDIAQGMMDAGLRVV